MYIFMVLKIRDKVDAPIHTHLGYNPEELVFRIGDAQRDDRMERIGPNIQNNIQI
jgi:hypothetical protein